ncbi:hypothetical protein Tco_0975758 [Tanacetum coccineum]|uniref:Uncharacterized protein n=1 Tax=Tanacetum coccineum TaxID=301880 RepID=A0ABQ5EFH7_9ASTR
MTMFYHSFKRPRSLSDLPEAADIVRGNSLTNSQPVYNQAAGLVFVPTQVSLSRWIYLSNTVLSQVEAMHKQIGGLRDKWPEIQTVIAQYMS